MSDKNNSQKLVEKKEIKESQNIIIFGDMHIFPDAFSVLISSLKVLQKQGYDTVYLEAIKDTDIDALIKRLNERIHLLEIFKTPAIVSKETIIGNIKTLNAYYPNIQQTIQLNAQGLIDSIKDDLTFDLKDGSRLEWLKSKKSFLEKVKELGLRTVCVDLPNQASAPYRIRNPYMAKNISEDLTKNPKSKGIFIVGFNHVTDIWETNAQRNKSFYARSVTRLLQKGGVVVKNAFLFYQKENENHNTVETAKKGIEYCGNDLVQLITVTPIKADTDIVSICCSEAKITVSQAKSVKKSYFLSIRLNSQKNDYDESYLNDLKNFLEDVGGKTIGAIEKSREHGFYYIKAEFPFSLTNKPCELLVDIDLFRRPIDHLLLTSKNIELLGEKFPLLTLEGPFQFLDGTIGRTCIVPCELESLLNQFISSLKQPAPLSKTVSPESTLASPPMAHLMSQIASHSAGSHPFLGNGSKIKSDTKKTEIESPVSSSNPDGRVEEAMVLQAEEGSTDASSSPVSLTS